MSNTFKRWESRLKSAQPLALDTYQSGMPENIFAYSTNHTVWPPLNTNSSLLRSDRVVGEIGGFDSGPNFHFVITKYSS